MTDPTTGTIVTFYSYKGGTGRTMALANVAWILAAAGKKVLVVDWDLEAPGLHRFLAPFLKVSPIEHMPGVIDMVREYEDRVAHDPHRNKEFISRFAKVDRYALSIDFAFPGRGGLDLLPAGRQNASYAATLGALDWDVFYDNLGGAAFFDALRQDMRSGYDYTLIDSRTGFSDVADICTQHLPDVLVDCYVLSNQAIDGAARVARAVTMFVKRRGPDRAIRILPVAMRVDGGEMAKAEAGRKLARRFFDGLPIGMSEPERSRYFASVEVPYQTYYAYEETLATFGNPPGNPTSLLAAYERLTAVITNREVTSFPAMDEADREYWLQRFERSTRPEREPIRIRYMGADHLWADWVRRLLRQGGVPVVDVGPMEIEDADAPSGKVLTIMSPSYLTARTGPGRDPWLRAPHLAIQIENVRPSDRVGTTLGRVAEVGPELNENEAARAVLQLVGLDAEMLATDASRTRYPGAEPHHFKAPARNANFTGRTEDLLNLRRHLVEGRPAVMLPITLHGMGGIGKTQLALEYAHRFRADYDLVWWIAAEPVQFVDAALMDLGGRLGVVTEGVKVEGAKMTLDALRSGAVGGRWLLIYDNAEEPEALERLLPHGGPGHVLITSRNREWPEQVHMLTVDVFHRTESVAHLQGRVEGLSTEHAAQVAEALGDLPIAVSAAGAWLAETGLPVAEYLRAVQEGDAGRRAVQATWDLSLQRLRERSLGAHRLLQVCSVLAPDIALDLLYSDKLMSAIAAHDPTAAERDMRGTLVQSINRLALLKLDVPARQVQVHRLLQEVVRERMTSSERKRLRHEVHLALAAFRPDGEPDDPVTWDRFRMIWRHLRVSGAETCVEESVRSLIVDRVRYLWRRGDLAEARLLGERVAQNWTDLLAQVQSPESPAITDVEPLALHRQLLRLRFTLANVLRDLADFVEALRVDEEVLAGQQELLGEGHAHTLMTKGSYAADLVALGRYADALPLAEATYEAWLERFGDSHPLTLRSANNLAAALRAVGGFTRATVIDEEVVERRRDVLGSLHPHTLHSQAALGIDLRESGRYRESVRVFRAVLKQAKEHLGENDADTLRAQVGLAASLRSLGKPVEAAPLLDDALQRLINRFGEQSPAALACRLTRAGNLLSFGQLDASLAEMVAVTAIYHETLGAEHPFSLVCTSNQSAVWSAQGDVGRATKLATAAAEGCSRTLGKEHPHYLAASMNEAASRYGSGDADVAATGMRAAVDLMESALGSKHPDYLICRGNLTLIETSSPGDAHAAAFGELAELLGDDHPSVISLRAGRLVFRVTDPQDPF